MKLHYERIHEYQSPLKILCSQLNKNISPIRKIFEKNSKKYPKMELFEQKVEFLNQKLSSLAKESFVSLGSIHLHIKLLRI